MRVYILGVDGYLGWPLRNALISAGHTVRGCDNFFRRRKAESLVPLIRADHTIDVIDVVTDTRHLTSVLKDFQPAAIVHLAQMPSAPYSMIDSQAATSTMSHNTASTISLIYAMRAACPDAHILKLGSMGEYIPSSWYHLSKVHDSANLKWACENWGIRCTDVMQGPVYGVGGRFDYDEMWGTVINRWVCMGVSGHQLLVYGTGEQVRGFLPIHDSIACFQIALANPPGAGEYRVINQYAAKYTLNELAALVSNLTGAAIEWIDNPRKESLSYEGDVGNGWLVEHGYKPSVDAKVVISELINQVRPFKSRIDAANFMPRIHW